MVRLAFKVRNSMKYKGEIICGSRRAKDIFGPL